MAAQDQANAVWQRDVLVSLLKLACVTKETRDQGAAIAQADRALVLAQGLAQRFPNNPQHQHDLEMVEKLQAEIHP